MVPVHRTYSLECHISDTQLDVVDRKMKKQDRFSECSPQNLSTCASCTYLTNHRRASDAHVPFFCPSSPIDSIATSMGEVSRSSADGAVTAFLRIPVIEGFALLVCGEVVFGASIDMVGEIGSVKIVSLSFRDGIEYAVRWTTNLGIAPRGRLW